MKQQFVLSREQTDARWAEADLSREALKSLGHALVVKEPSGSIVPSQLDLHDDGGGTLLLDLEEVTADKFAVGAGQEPARGELCVSTLAEYEGQEAYRIVTGAGEWVYHKSGAGFASLIDRDGNDWLSFRPYGGSDGMYRGIPNLAHPDNVFHPGHRTCTTSAARVGPLRVTFDSRSNDGDWACRWQIYPDHADLTVTRVGHPYWLLYEGTPAGRLDAERDFCVRSDSVRRPLSEAWDEVLPDPKWIAFGKQGVDRAFWLQSHSPENADSQDSFWPMEDNMTVFGFGRLNGDKFMTHVPARFTFGLAETSDAEALGRSIASASGRAPLVPTSG